MKLEVVLKYEFEYPEKTILVTLSGFVGLTGLLSQEQHQIRFKGIPLYKLEVRNRNHVGSKKACNYVEL